MRSSGFWNAPGILAVLSLLILAGPTTPIAQEAEELAAAPEVGEAVGPSLREEVRALREELRVARAQIQILKSTIDAVAAESAAQSALALAKRTEPEEVRTRSWQTAAPEATSPAGQVGQQVAALSDAVPSSDPLMVGEVHFNPGSADLSPGARSKTTRAAEQIKSMEGGKIRVVGYTDTTGSSGYNKHLALMRADSIAKLLERLGVSRELIEVVGHGEEGTPVPTADQIAEPLNRCAGIFVVADAAN
jgi:outer membrane protein OmpA-like peptidoglycan-associated protein